ncbi:MAG: leucine--tRNA ligase [Pseudomonadota bacterium]|nr:leucine--tRNA ligase [Pseudomonadota bacterium]
MTYTPHEFEKKWQLRWEVENPYRAANPGEAGSERPAYYVLDMFPYPSGSGLHVGHASGYIATDVIARKRRMEGYNVLHPMGWDAFGLPAEQYAIQTGQHPRETTETNTANFRRQLKMIGLSYDWTREIDTSSPGYYRWTQWIFLKLFERGLVYRKDMPVWWCEELKTVLANEEVINGRSERGNHHCERRMLSQWLLRITQYADRLVEDLEGLDWPESVKKMQRDWVGRSVGARVGFQRAGGDERIEVFTTRPDTLYGVTALALAPEHPQTQSFVTDEHRAAVEAYCLRAASRSERERKSDGNQAVTAQATGGFVRHPLRDELLIPVYVADYVLLEYGTGAVMVVPAHDERDHELARSVGLEVRHVVVPEPGGALAEGCYIEDGYLTASFEFNGLDSETARARIIERLELDESGHGQVTYRLRDWIFSRQRYWGEPIPLLIDREGGLTAVPEDHLPVELPLIDDFLPSADGSSPLARAGEWRYVVDPQSGETHERVMDTMPGWAGSCWYYLRFMDTENATAPFSQDAVRYWGQVDLYVGGASHAVMHLLYARFWHKVLFDLGLVPTPEPFKKLFNQGMVTSHAFRDSDGRLIPVDEVEGRGESYHHRTTGKVLERFGSKMAKSLKNVVNPDDVIAARGCDAFRMYEMFMAPLDAEKPWSEEGISGCEKFLKRLWTMLIAPDGKVRLSDEGSIAIERSLHRCLDRVDRSFENFNFNTAVAGLMEMLNEISASRHVPTRAQAEFLTKMLSPFAPHFAAEVWERLGHPGFIDAEAWPALDRQMLKNDTFELVVQVSGKVRGRCEMPLESSEAEVREAAVREASSWLQGKTVVREIYVKNRLYNFATA